MVPPQPSLMIVSDGPQVLRVQQVPACVTGSTLLQTSWPGPLPALLHGQLRFEPSPFGKLDDAEVEHG